MRRRSAPRDTLSDCLARLRSLPRASWTPVSDRGHAAVLVVLFDCSSDPTPRLLLTRRADLRSHSGEVALPGGRRDPEDEVEAAAAAANGGAENGGAENGGGSGGGEGEGAGASRNASTGPSPGPSPPLLSVDAVTALREAREEIGLEPSALEVVAELPPLLSKHLLSVAVVVAVLREKPESVESFLESLKPSPAEVDAAFEAPLADFLDPPSCSATAARSAAGVTKARTVAGATTAKTAAAAAASERGPAESSTSSGSSRSPFSCIYSHRDCRFGRVPDAPRFRLHFFEMRDRPCVSPEESAKGARRRDDFLVWGLTAGIAVEVAEAALGRPPTFEVSPPRAAPYSRICCFRDSNGGMPMVMGGGGGGAEREKGTTVKKRKR